MPWLGEVVDPFLEGFWARHRGVTLWTMGMFGLSTAIESFVLPRIMSHVVARVKEREDLDEGEEADESVRRSLLLLAMLYALAQYAYAAYEEARNQMEPLLHSYIMNELVERVMRRYAATFQHVNTAVVYSKIELIHEYLRRIMFKVFTSGLPELATMVGLGLSFAEVDLGLGAAVGVMLGGHFAYIATQTGQCQRPTTSHALFQEQVADHLNDRLVNLDAVVTAAHGRGLDQELVAVRAMSEYRTLLHQVESNCMSRQRGGYYGSSALLMLVVVTYAYHLYSRRTMSAEGLGTVLFTLGTLFSHTYYLSHTIPGVTADLRNLNVHAEFLREILATGGEDERAGANADGGALVEFRGVHFAYPGGGAAELFGGVDLVVPRGVLVGVVGPSGAGKSTLARMVMGQLRPARGRVTVGGTDAHSLRPGAVAHIAQNTTRLFHESVRYNIEYGHTAPEMRAYWAQAGLAGGLDEWVADLGLGDILPPLDSSAGRLGEGLSGGQRQIVHLLRCVLNRRARVVVLDEPTSALDGRTTQAVCRLLEVLAADPGRTVLVVTHDPAVQKVCRALVRFPHPRIFLKDREEG
jgi:ABC-type multidrug transport system fused ATPase/permease subunit